MDGIKDELASFCDIVCLVSAGNEEAAELYTRNAPDIDCFICSGLLLFYAIKTRVPVLGKPVYALDDQRADIKSVFLDLLLEKRSFDLSRIFIDFAYEGNDYLGIKAWLPRGQWPYFGEIDMSEIKEYEQVERICQAIKERHYRLHEAGLVDLSLTRVALLARDFERDGIAYRYVYPSRDYIVNFILQIVSAFNSKKNEESALGAISLIIEGSADRSALAERALAAYLKDRGYDFTVQKEDDRIVLLGRKADLADMSSGFTACDLGDYIAQATGSTVAIGLGSGNNFFQAKLNAARAAELSRARSRGRSRAAFFVSDKDELLGPLGSRSSPGPAEALSSAPSAELLDWARRLGVDHLSLQKILAFARSSGSTRLYSDELARSLGVTLRSANRLLRKIEAGGGATSYLENARGGRGRPRKRYELRLGGII